MPVFAPATLKSSTTGITCARTASAVWCDAPKTPVVFWYVSDVTAAVAKHPKAVMVFTSATIPAPPEGSNPATVNTTGGVPSLTPSTSATSSFIIRRPTDRASQRTTARVQVLDEMHRPREVLSVREEPYSRDAFGPRVETVAGVGLVNSAERDERERLES